MKGLGMLVVGGAIVAALGYSGVVSQYADVSGFSEDYSKGRTKNAISAVIAGVVAQKMYDNANINLEVEKTLFPDATITGHTTKDSIDTYINLWFSHVQFTAGKKDGLMKGEVDKSEFNWHIVQKNKNNYEIQRILWKWDGNLKIDVKDGKISGVYERGGLAWDWDINGTYDKEGNVSIEVDAPWTLDFDLVGKITKQ